MLLWQMDPRESCQQNECATDYQASWFGWLWALHPQPRTWSRAGDWHSLRASEPDLSRHFGRKRMRKETNFYWVLKGQGAGPGASVCNLDSFIIIICYLWSTQLFLYLKGWDTRWGPFHIVQVALSWTTRLRPNSHTLPFTHLKYAIRWFLV